ncbi:MAG: Peptidoglycan-binding domain 1 [Polaromonas sp.]|nr:Peptidoglycan-binding domain 1 [Polaromonas sp.]
MYAPFFGLSQEPFSIAPDPRYLFMSDRHREALAHLLYGLRGGGGFVLLSGEVGTGKTTVCRCFLEQVPPNCNVAYIFNPKLSSRELLRTICDEFHIELPASAASAKDFIDPLNQFLLREHAAGKSNVLVIDEAQNLSASVLEQLRLLTNLETNERKLLQIVLIGQPELRQMLALPQLEQLAQRVTARFHLDALSLPETAHYIAHRLAVAGLKGASPFDSKAVARVHKLSRGVPRRINLLCDRAMLGAYAASTAHISRRIVDKAALEVFGPVIKTAFGSAGTVSGIEPRPARVFARLQAKLAGKTEPRGQAATGSAGARWAVAVTGLLVVSALVWLVQTQAGKSEKDTSAADKSTPAAGAAVDAGPATAASSSSARTAAAPSADPAPAAVAGPAVSAVPALSADVLAALARAPADKNSAWQTVGEAWGLTLVRDEPCEAARQQRVYCFSADNMPMSLIRELDRPGIITLATKGQPGGFAVLTGLAGQQAVLRIGSETHTVSLGTLADLWQGDFSTLRRAPEDMVDHSVNASGRPSPAWLAARLEKIPGTPPVKPLPGDMSSQQPLQSALRHRINSFQMAHGLAADGVAGPLTLMQLNRATGVAEPRLSSPPGRVNP